MISAKFTCTKISQSKLEAHLCQLPSNQSVMTRGLLLLLRSSEKALLYISDVSWAVAEKKKNLQLLIRVRVRVRLKVKCLGIISSYQSKVIWTHPHGTMNIWTKCYYNVMPIHSKVVTKVLTGRLTNNAIPLVRLKGHNRFWADIKRIISPPFPYQSNVFVVRALWLKQSWLFISCC